MLCMNVSKLAAIAATAFAGFAATAHAETWDQSHPRRAEVNGRLANQNFRIDQERREGEITRGQARTLHAEDHQIRREERRMAAADGGHITRFDQRILNRQENMVSHQIGR
jgi:hypothetical protein